LKKFCTIESRKFYIAVAASWYSTNYISSEWQIVRWNRNELYHAFASDIL